MPEVRQFQAKDVEEILERIFREEKKGVTTDVIDPIFKAVQKLRQVYADLILLPRAESLTTRVKTLQTLLVTFEDEIGETYPVVLRKAGQLVGSSFATDFMDSLKSVGSVPMNLDALLATWLRIESNANWARFSFRKLPKGEVRIQADNLFLTRGLIDGVHRHCAFMEGYIDGFLWDASKRSERWFRQEFHATPEESFPEPISIVETPLENLCVYQVRFQPEILVKAFDAFYRADESYRAGRYRDVAVDVRSALELACRSKTELEPSDRTPPTTIVRAFRDLNLLPSAVSYRAIKDLYGRTSAVVHSAIPSTEELSRQILEEGAQVLRVLELMVIPKEVRTQLRTEIAKGQPETTTE